MYPKKVLHISYMPGNTWGYKIWNAVNNAEKRNEKLKLPQETRKAWGNIMLAISYRLDSLPIIVERINQDVKTIYDLAGRRDKSKDIYAFDGIPSYTIHSLLTDIDSFVFETRSCCELIEKLIKQISRHFKKYSPAVFTEEVPDERWLKRGWYEDLKSIRIDIFHHTASYVDIDVSDESKYDLLFPRENIHDYEQSQKFFRLSELANIEKGFGEGAMYLQDYIINKIDSVDLVESERIR